MNHGKTKKKNDPLKENTFAFPNHFANSMWNITPLFLAATLSYSVVIYEVEVSKCLPNGCQSEKNIALKQLHFLKWILFPKVVMEHTVSPRGLHAACGPYVVQGCSRVLAIILWLYFNFFSR